MTDDANRPPFRIPRLAPAAVDVRAEGETLILASPLALQEHPGSLIDVLRGHARTIGDRVFLTERSGEGWRAVTYAEFVESMDAIACGLVARGLDEERPVAILSGNGIDHALLAHAAMSVGIPVAPISPAYSLLCRDLEKLGMILDILRPGLVYAEQAGPFERALATCPSDVVHTGSPLALEAPPSGDVERRREAVGPDTVAKVLFTSGSTGEPKGVLNTQRMLCSNQQAIHQLWPFLSERPVRVVDWLPWSHTFGSNHNFNLVLWHGGTLTIDGGKPVPGAIEETVRNLREVSPTLYFNVPRGFDVLLPYLERDAELRASFFRDLDLIFYAGAALPPHLWSRLEKVAIEATGERVLLVSAWGSTETAPMATAVHFPIERAGVIGLPAPGTEIKLVPSGGKFELRVKGPNVTPGYWRRDDLTRDACDDEGFFRMGDAGHLEDPEHPERGLVFDGRTAESFKLLSGTWVSTSRLRTEVIAAGAPVIQDAVVTGHDRDFVGLLVFPSLEGCRSLVGDGSAELSELVRRDEVREALRAGLERYNGTAGGESRCVARVLFLVEPPSIDRGEITDKGYINQRAVLEHRRGKVERLHAEPPDEEVLLLTE